MSEGLLESRRPAARLKMGWANKEALLAIQVTASMHGIPTGRDRAGIPLEERERAEFTRHYSCNASSRVADLLDVCYKPAVQGTHSGGEPTRGAVTTGVAMI